MTLAKWNGRTRNGAVLHSQTEGGILKIGHISTVFGIALLATACAAEEPHEEISSSESELSWRSYNRRLVRKVRYEIAARGIQPTEAAPEVSDELFELGQALAFDKLLSGNRDISCMTCHHSDIGTDDDRALPLGTGGVGLGVDRVGGPIIPRNAPALFNLHTMDVMFWDGRVVDNLDGTFTTPAGAEITPEMEAVFDFGAASAQAMFPVTSNHEMAGEHGENEIADAPSNTVLWERVMVRLGGVPEYVEMFEDAYPGEDFDDMTFAHAANAIAGFEIRAFASYDSPWEDFLHGDDSALSRRELRGALKFFDKGCANCHSGSNFTDESFHNTALAQFGPGKGDGASGTDDHGHARVSGDPADIYKFRTPPLVNIELTGPYGHDGQYATLKTFVAHYNDPEDELRDYDITEHVDDDNLWGMVEDNVDDVIATMSPGTASNLRRRDVRLITRFLKALTADSSRDLRDTVPDSVPSGLPVPD